LSRDNSKQSVMSGYYSEKLAAEKLRRCYEIAPPRVKQYLAAEIAHAADLIGPTDSVLELGCGYGRVMKELSAAGRLVVGIDISFSSLRMAREFLSESADCHLLQMDAVSTGFQDSSFDTIVCIQNGISAFNVDRARLVAESVRIARPGGLVLLSTYSDTFWTDRLDWFRRQAEAGLLGEIDEEATGDGVIVCKDGFRATTVTAGEFFALTTGLNVDSRIVEVDDSSLFCEMRLRE